MSVVIELSDSDSDEPVQKKITPNRPSESIIIQLDSDSDLEDVVGTWSSLDSSKHNRWTQECPICCDDISNGEMVHCMSGHEVCTRCLQRYAQEAITGNGKASLPCMLVDDCESSYSRAQRLVALNVQQYKKLDEREQQESLRLADIDDLITCPFCQYSAILTNTQVFSCLKCNRQSCKLCQIEWKEHVGKTCKELENNDEAAFRKQYEEKMTSARVRYCPRCKQSLIKESGCNKMTCKCGTTFCYICSQQGNYDHFCQCGKKVVGTKCTLCKRCVLHTDVDKLDDNNIKNLQRQAEEAQKESGLRQRAIGVAPSTASSAAPTQPEPLIQFDPVEIFQRMPELVDQLDHARRALIARKARLDELREARLAREQEIPEGNRVQHIRPKRK